MSALKKVAGAILVLPDGRWVMQRRTADAPTDPSKLSFFGGSLEGDETPYQGFLRELAEETNLPLSELEYPLACKLTIGPEHYGKAFTSFLYRVEIPSLDFEVYEGTGAEAYTTSELAKRKDVAVVVLQALKTIAENTNGA